MKIFKITFFSLSLLFLSGCFQTTALLGPGVTVATSGNVLQAGLQYGANTAVKNETGEYPLEYIKNSVEEKNNQKKFYVDFKNFIEDRIQASRRKLSLN
tara:strand:+ start:1747 stop:2043 length:297 start_codon:yes stop_codon:yes gene_type:complete